MKGLSFLLLFASLAGNMVPEIDPDELRERINAKCMAIEADVALLKTLKAS